MTVQRFVFQLFAASALLVWLNQFQSKGDIPSMHIVQEKWD